MQTKWLSESNNRLKWSIRPFLRWGTSNTNYGLVINGSEELDLKKAATFLHEKSISLIPVSHLLSTSGYVRGGCSPLGMKKLFTTCFDQKIEQLDKIIVSAGRIGLQMEINPRQLISIIHGQVSDLIRMKQSE